MLDKCKNFSDNLRRFRLHYFPIYPSNNTEVLRQDIIHFNNYIAIQEEKMNYYISECEKIRRKEEIEPHAESAEMLRVLIKHKEKEIFKLKSFTLGLRDKITRLEETLLERERVQRKLEAESAVVEHYDTQYTKPHTTYANRISILYNS